MKIACFTTLLPVRSGISDYNGDLLPFLSKYVDIDIFIDDYEPAKELRQRFNIYSYKEFERRYASGEYDLVLYHMGNNPYHFYLYPFLIKYPGITVLHDYVLHHFYSGMTWIKGDVEGYLEELRYNHGKMGEELGKVIVKGMITGLELFVFPMNKRIIDSSLGVIVHSDYIKGEIENYHPGANVKKIHMGIPAIDSRSFNRREAKEKLGIPSDSFVLGVFGFVTPMKRVALVLNAFNKVLKVIPDAILLIVGNIEDDGIDEMIKELNLEKNVRITGYVPGEDFKAYIMATDIAVNLRYPTAGETSASLLRIMGMGVPVIIFNYRQFAEIPDDSCVKIDLGENEVDDLYRAIKKVDSSNYLLRKIGEKGREYVLKNCNLEESAREYYDFILNVFNKNRVNNYRGKMTARFKSNMSKDLAEMGVTKNTSSFMYDVTKGLKEMDIE